MPDLRHYLLVVRFPTGGIRTHLAYARQLAAEEAALLPVLVCPDGPEGRTLADQLGIPQDRYFATPNDSVIGLARSILRAAGRFRVRVVHSHGFSSAIASFATVLAFRLRHIVTVHDQVTTGLLLHIGRTMSVALGGVLRQAFAVHAVGEDCAASIRTLPLMKDASNIRVIPNGINPARFANVTPSDIVSLCGLSEHVFFVGFFGRFMSPKGFRTLVDAVELIEKVDRDARFMVIAVGGGGFVREDKAYIAERNLMHRFRFIEFAENPAPLMAAMNVVAMPSKWEAFGLVAAEVMALGVPLIASDCVGLREVTRGTPARTFPSGDAAALARELRDEMKTSTRAAAQLFVPNALQRFDFSSSARRIEQLLLEASQ